jgi:hypothetical protein
LMSAKSNGCVAFLLTVLCGAPALAQRQVDPNIGHFYMARQQITITDDSPVVQNKTNGPQSNAGGGGGQGGMQNAPAALPRAGWMPYSQDVPGLRTNLPATNNGVPQKPPPQQAQPRGQHAGRGGLLKSSNGGGNGGGNGGKSSKPGANSATAAAPANRNAVQAYSPYKHYAPESPASGSAAMQSNANVKGNVLHWARRGLGH